MRTRCGLVEMTHAERKLVAILAADVVGYSRLMEVDEAGTLARLKTHRLELIDPTIARHRGRIIKTTGDGLLVEFQSVVDAVQCACEIQTRMARRNADVSPARAIQLRIGINLGDVIVEGDDIFGDGVNVAARLEALLRPRARVLRGARTRAGGLARCPISAAAAERDPLEHAGIELGHKRSQSELFRWTWIFRPSRGLVIAEQCASVFV